MSNFADIVRSVMGVQPGAQGNLPIMPNNGNPMGANNTPTNVQPIQAPMNPMLQHYPWLAASPAMGQVQQMLSSPLFMNNVHPIQAGGGPIPAPGTGHAIPMPLAPGAVPPTLPAPGTGHAIPMPTVPGTGGVAPPVLPYGPGGGGLGWGPNASGANIGQLQGNPVIPLTTYDQDQYGARKVF